MMTDSWHITALAEAYRSLKVLNEYCQYERNGIVVS
jgi:hypothetical protein